MLRREVRLRAVVLCTWIRLGAGAELALCVRRASFRGLRHHLHRQHQLEYSVDLIGLSLAAWHTEGKNRRLDRRAQPHGLAHVKPDRARSCRKRSAQRAL